jgi:hypothetical protein
MANLKVYLTAETKRFRRALKRAEYRLNRFANQVKRYGVIAGAAFAAASAKSVQMFAEQEDAERGLAAALRAHGDSVDLLLPKYKRFASRIQSQTKFGDEYVLSLMKQIRNLGIMPNQMEKVTRGAIGLSEALGLNIDSAARYTALAIQGETTILQRYVPALREAETAAEKQAIVQGLMARGFKQAQEAAETTGGQFTQVKNSIGDVMEGFGQLLVETGKLMFGTNDLAGSIGKVASEFKARVPHIAHAIATTFVKIKFGALQVYHAFKDVGTNIWRVFRWSFNRIWEAVKLYAQLVKRVWGPVIKTIKNQFSILLSGMQRGIGAFWQAIKERDLGKVKEAASAFMQTGKSLAQEQKRARQEWMDSVFQDIDLGGVFKGLPQLIDPGQKFDKLYGEKRQALAELDKRLRKSVTRDVIRDEEKQRVGMWKRMQALGRKRLKQMMAVTKGLASPMSRAPMQIDQRGIGQVITDRMLRVGAKVGHQRTRQNPQVEEQIKTNNFLREIENILATMEGTAPVFR